MEPLKDLLVGIKSYDTDGWVGYGEIGGIPGIQFDTAHFDDRLCQLKETMSY